MTSLEAKVFPESVTPLEKHVSPRQTDVSNFQTHIACERGDESCTHLNTMPCDCLVLRIIKYTRAASS